MPRAWAIALSLAACRAVSGGSDPLAGDGSSAISVVDPGGARSQVRLTWRLFETQHWLDGSGRDHQSAVFELLVNGGAPSRVELGRRDSSGCRRIDDAPSGLALAGVDCHGARAWVVRASGAELRVVASDRDPAYRGDDAPVFHEQTATVRIPPDADIAVDLDLARIPDETPGP